MKPKSMDLRSETEADRFWREKIEECPDCWRPFALVAAVAALILLFA
ncbi:MAG: hypothetical protein ACFCUS_04490 [Rubrimonas sp.]